MWIELIAAAYLVGRYIYHRATEDDDIPKNGHASFKVPAADDGDVVPLVFGRCRIRNPIAAWISKPHFDTNGFSPAVYQCNIFYILGVGMEEGNGTSRIYNIWLGDTKFAWNGTLLTPYTGNQTGAGNFESPIFVERSTEDGEYIGGYMEFLNGNSSQQLVDGSSTAVTYTGQAMMDTGTSTHLPPSRRLDANLIPGYRGYLSAFLHFGNINAGAQWRIGRSGTIPNYSFEVASYPLDDGLSTIGPDCNPVKVIKEIIIRYWGKLGLGSSTVDTDSFVAAGVKLKSESHGYSRAMEDPKAAEEWIMEILKQIDAAMYEDSATGKIKIKLIRNDYDPATIPIIDKSNCHELQSFAAGGWTGVINKLRLVYTNRDDDYREASVTIQNMANAVGQDGIVREQVIRMLGITNEYLAWRVAARELQARSRPLMKCRAIVDRSKIRLNQGEAIRLVWNDPDVNVIFRVANVSHGVINDGKVALDLIQDYFYTTGTSFPTSGGLGGFGDLGIRGIIPFPKGVGER